MQKTVARRAAKPRQCDECGDGIEPGDIYVEAVLSPNHDGLGNIGWWRMSECPGCARRYGHGDLIEARAAA